MEIQGGLVGWDVEKLAKMPAGGHSVTLSMGAFFRLRLDIPGGAPLSGALELTQPGGRLELLRARRHSSKCQDTDTL